MLKANLLLCIPTNFNDDFFMFYFFYFPLKQIMNCYLYNDYNIHRKFQTQTVYCSFFPIMNLDSL